MEDPAPSEQSRSVLRDLRMLLAFLKPFKSQMVRALLLIGTINALGVWGVYIIGKAINQMADPDRSGVSPVQAVVLLAALYLAINVTRAVLMRFREPTAMRLAMDLVRSLRTTLYSKVQTLSFSHLDRLTSGQIIERATGDVNQIRNFLTETCFQAFDGIVMGVIAIGFMFYMSPKLALVTLMPFPVIALLYKWAVRRLRYLRRRVRDEIDVMTTQLAEGIAGARVIRSFGRQDAQRSRYRTTLDEILSRVRPIFRIRATTLNAVYALARLWAAVILGVGGWLVIRGELKVGFLLPFTMYMMWLLWRVQMIMEVGEHAQDARSALERMQALLDAAPDVQDAPDARDLPPGDGAIVFDNVSFAYVEPPHPEADVVERMNVAARRKGPDAVRDIRLTVQPGETVALVGPTGAGKSTIISLLPRFYDPTQGRVLIDGQDVRHTRLDSLRSNIGIVFQETFLFRGSIAENVAYGRPEAAHEDIMDAARLAQADDFIRELPHAYDTEIGERGVTLSGGQRQRLAIARAILKQPRILVLDDALSAVDAHTEHKIRHRLDLLMQGRTTLIIAHRLATVRAADRVVVLREGRLDDVGTHQELMQRNDFYRMLCHSQLEQDLAAVEAAPADPAGAADALPRPGGAS